MKKAAPYAARCRDARCDDALRADTVTSIVIALWVTSALLILRWEEPKFLFGWRMSKVCSTPLRVGPSEKRVPSQGMPVTKKSFKISMMMSRKSSKKSMPGRARVPLVVTVRGVEMEISLDKRAQHTLSWSLPIVDATGVSLPVGTTNLYKYPLVTARPLRAHERSWDRGRGAPSSP